jgi:hypothetical protein
MCPEETGAEDVAPAPTSALTYGGGPAVSWGSPPPAKRGHSAASSRGVLVAAVAVALVVAGGVGVATSTHGGGAHSASPVVGSLARAAYVTTQAPGFDFDLDITASVGPQVVTISGEGSLNERAVEGTMNLQVAGKTVSEIIKKPYVYIQVPSGAGALSGGKPWISANLETFVHSLGSSGPLGGDTAGPTQMLSMLKSSGQVMTLGSESLHGVSTTHYHALVDFSRYAATVPSSLRPGIEGYARELQRITGSSSLPIDVWVDSEQRVRRFSTELQICTPQGKLAETVAMDLYDFGPQPAVLAPAPSEVSDITSELSSQATQTMAQLSC